MIIEIKANDQTVKIGDLHTFIAWYLCANGLRPQKLEVYIDGKLSPEPKWEEE